MSRRNPLTIGITRLAGIKPSTTSSEKLHSTSAVTKLLSIVLHRIYLSFINEKNIYIRFLICFVVIDNALSLDYDSDMKLIYSAFNRLVQMLSTIYKN